MLKYLSRVRNYASSVPVREPGRIGGTLLARGHWSVRRCDSRLPGGMAVD